MLEGLEISEVLISELEFSSRIDSEYYKKHLLNFENIVKTGKYAVFSKVANFLIGPFGSAFNTENYVEDGDYRYVRGQDVKPFILKDGENRYLPREDYDRLIKYALKEKDILISVVGTLGNACIVQLKDLPGIFSCKSTVVRVTDINPVYALTYLNSSFGKELLMRKERGAIQKGLNLDDLKTTIIPIFSNEFQLKIEGVFYLAQDKITDSKNYYKKAENLLLETLGLNNFEPTSEAVNVKSFNESFLSSGRLDAEYYQKKYDDYINLICSYPNGYEIIEVACIQKDINYTPKDNTEYKYIELANIGKTGDIKGCTIAIGSELPTRARRKVNTNDVIISSIEGSLDSCALVTEEYDNALCSTGFYIISSNKINSETLLVLFKSEPIQNILRKGCSGTILTAINKTEFQNIPIPIIDKQIQEKIASLVSESFMLKKQSEQLLEIAKRAVEIAIEEGEEVAMRYIDDSKKLN